MYEFFRGELLELLPTSAVVEVGGIGHSLAIPLSTHDLLKRLVGERVLLYAHLYVREDELRLFGFATKAERSLFRMVLSVSGVGPAIALACLSALRPAEVLDALARGESRTLQRVKGVGRKVAERMVVDLKDRAESLVETNGGDGAASGSSRSSGWGCGEKEDAIRALVELGYQRKAAESMVEGALEEFCDRKDRVSLEDLVKKCLRR